MFITSVLQCFVKRMEDLIAIIAEINVAESINERCNRSSIDFKEQHIPRSFLRFVEESRENEMKQ